MERKHNSGGSPFRKQQNRTHLGGLCSSRKLEEPQRPLRGQKLQHLQRLAQTLGTVLGRQRRWKHFLLRRIEGRRDGLLDRRPSSARWHKAQASPPVFQTRVGLRAPVQPGFQRWWKVVAGRIRFYIHPEK